MHEMMKRMLLLSLMLVVALCGVAQSFPFPDVPDTMTDPAQRMDCLLTNYWSRYDFNDTTEVNRKVGEQGLVDFVYVLGMADAELLHQASHRFVEAAFTTEWSARHYDHLLEHYLLNPNSPLRNDIVYAAFLKEIVASCKPCEGAMLERSKFRLSQVDRNQVGTTAADFAFKTRDGRKGRLSDMGGDYLLLVFHDPDCENCERILPQLMREPLLCDSRVQALMVYPDDNMDEWRRKVYDVPSNWTDAYNPDGDIRAKSLYFISATPSLYLLDKSKNVLLKDTTPDNLLRVLSNLLKNE